MKSTRRKSLQERQDEVLAANLVRLHKEKILATKARTRRKYTRRVTAANVDIKNFVWTTQDESAYAEAVKRFPSYSREAYASRALVTRAVLAGADPATIKKIGVSQKKK